MSTTAAGSRLRRSAGSTPTATSIKLPQTLLVADYASLEVGILGDFCSRLFGDDQILDMYLAQAKGVDIHANTARAVFGEWLHWCVPDKVKLPDGTVVKCKYAGKRVDRIPTEEFKTHPYGALLREMIKEIRYGLAYGKSAYGFSTLVGVDGKFIGEDLAKAMVNALLDAEPGQRKWQKWVEGYVRQHHGIYSLGGRWCDLSLEMESGDEWQIRRAIRRALNFPCQATGAEIIGDAMVRLARCSIWALLEYVVALQIHDELLTRGPLVRVEKAKPVLVGHMTSATANGTKLLVGLQVTASHAENYYKAK